MSKKSKELADKFILLEKDVRLNFYKITAVLWKLKDFEDLAYQNPELSLEIDIVKNFLIIRSDAFNKLTLNGHIHHLSYKSGAKEEKHYIALLSYSNGDADSLSSMDRDRLIMDINRLKEEKRQLEKKCKELFNKLKKFLSLEELRVNDVQIYIRVLKNSKKSPTYEGLEIASNKTVSKSTWDRRFKNISFLSHLIKEIDKLIKRTKNSERKDVYLEDSQRLNKIYEAKLVLDFECKRTAGKIKYKDDQEKDILENIPDTSYYNSSFDEAMEEHNR